MKKPPPKPEPRWPLAVMAMFVALIGLKLWLVSAELDRLEGFQIDTNDLVIALQGTVVDHLNPKSTPEPQISPVEREGDDIVDWAPEPTKLPVANPDSCGWAFENPLALADRFRRCFPKLVWP